MNWMKWWNKSSTWQYSVIRVPAELINDSDFQSYWERHIELCKSRADKEFLDKLHEEMEEDLQ